VFLVPQPSEEELTIYYNQAYAVPMRLYERGTRRNARLMLNVLNGRNSKGSVLEIGCSYGFFLDAARRDGWQTTGIEVDRSAASHAKETLGLRVFAGTLESEIANLNPPYDAIVSFHVIEHLRDPIGFLKICKSLLRKGGILILKTPNVGSWIAKKAGRSWQWLCPPAHIHLFGPKSLEIALAKTGFLVDQIQTRQGDAHNNLFELACAAARYARGRRTKGVGGTNAKSQSRKSWGSRWSLIAVRTLTEVIYLPLATLVDPHLERKGLQPELLAIAHA
jgi:SAM-dependent methyltransferase